MGTVSCVSIVSIIVCGLVCAIIPLILFLFYKKSGAHYIPFIMGVCVFFVLVLVIESSINSIIFSYTNIGSAISNKIAIYSLFVGGMAGIFEETGRLVAFKTVLKKYQNNDVNALMYGAGHAGCEAILVVSMAMFSNLVIAILINSGNEHVILGQLSGDILEQTRSQFQELINTPWYVFILSMVERIAAITMHLSLSILVWYAAKKRNRFFLYPVAVIIHMIVDAAATYLSYKDVNIFIIEFLLVVANVILAFFAKGIWNKETLKS